MRTEEWKRLDATERVDELYKAKTKAAPIPTKEVIARGRALAPAEFFLESSLSSSSLSLLLSLYSEADSDA